MLARVIKWPKAQGVGWLDKWKKHRRRVSELIETSPEGSWAKAVFRNRMRMAGHVQRHTESLVWAVINFRDLAWWRTRQRTIKKGSPLNRHPGRYLVNNWETDIEKYWNNPENGHFMAEFLDKEGYEPQCWGHLALNRDIWRRACQ